MAVQKPLKLSLGLSIRQPDRDSLIAPKSVLVKFTAMKRMKVVVECEFEFPDNYSIAPDHDGVPSLQIGRKIFVPAIRWMEQTVFLEGLIPERFETEPSRGFQPVDKETHDEIMNYQTVEDGHVEMAKGKSAD